MIPSGRRTHALTEGVRAVTVVREIPTERGAMEGSVT